VRAFGQAGEDALAAPDPLHLGVLDGRLDDLGAGARERRDVLAPGDPPDQARESRPQLAGQAARARLRV
jgi:hypothetical protein